MKQLAKAIGKILFWIFILAVAGWTASLTLAEVKAILPGDPITPYFALALFDGGAVTWLLVFIGHAKGLTQRAISLLLLVLDLAGIVILSAGRLLMGGQTLADVPKELGANMVYALIGATLINLIAIYAFHVSDPETMQTIELQTLDDSIQAEAMSQARANIEAEVQELAAIIAARSTARLKYALRLPTNDRETRELLTGEVSPAPLVIPAEPKPQATNAGTLFANLRRKMTRRRQPVATYEQAIPHPTMDARADELENKQPRTIADAVQQGIREAQAGAPDNYGPQWKASTDITPTLDAYAWVCSHCEGSNAPYVRKCQWCQQPRTNGSAVTAFSDMPPANQEEAKPASDSPFPGPRE